MLIFLGYVSLPEGNVCPLVVKHGLMENPEKLSMIFPVSMPQCPEKFVHLPLPYLIATVPIVVNGCKRFIIFNHYLGILPIYSYTMLSVRLVLNGTIT
jgi:hypothetical protein